MVINGYDFHFAYTVGAFCAIAEMKLENPKTMMDQCSVIMKMAVVMSKAYEDKKKIEDPSYQVRYLTKEEVSALSINEVVEQLSPEVDEAVRIGKYRTVVAEPKKK